MTRTAPPKTLRACKRSTSVRKTGQRLFASHSVLAAYDASTSHASRPLEVQSQFEIDGLNPLTQALTSKSINWWFRWQFECFHWCGWRGSNPRPLASEANTLSTELQPRLLKAPRLCIFAYPARAPFRDSFKGLNGAVMVKSARACARPPPEDAAIDATRHPDSCARWAHAPQWRRARRRRDRTPAPPPRSVPA